MMNLHLACRKLDILAVLQFLLAGESANCLDLLGESPLMYTINHTYMNPEIAVGIVECLLYFGADPNLRSNNTSLTPLMLAVLANNRDIVLRLLAYKADVNAVYIPEEECIIPRFSTAISICLSLTTFTDIAMDLFQQQYNMDLLIQAIGQAKFENIMALTNEFAKTGLLETI